MVARQLVQLLVLWSQPHKLAKTMSKATTIHNLTGEDLELDGVVLKGGGSLSVEDSEKWLEAFPEQVKTGKSPFEEPKASKKKK